MNAKHQHHRFRALSLEILEDRYLLSYSVLDLGMLPRTNWCVATGLNNAGQVVGACGAPSGERAFLWQDGIMTDLGALGGQSATARAINDLGQVVGYSKLANGQTHAFLYSDGIITDLGTLTGTGSSMAYGINNAGQIVGVSDFNSTYRAFLYSGGTMTQLGSLGTGLESLARGINDAGQVVGYSGVDFYIQHAFLWDATQGMQDLGTLRSEEFATSVAFAINNAGQVVGHSDDGGAFLYDGGPLVALSNDQFVFAFATAINSSGQVVGSGAMSGTTTSHALLYADGILADLNDLVPPGSGWTLRGAGAINDTGQILCTAVNAPQGFEHAFLLTPDGGRSPRSTGPGVFQVLATTPEAAPRIANVAVAPRASLAPTGSLETALPSSVGITKHQATDTVFANVHRAQASDAHVGSDLEGWKSVFAKARLVEAETTPYGPLGQII